MTRKGGAERDGRLVRERERERETVKSEHSCAPLDHCALSACSRRDSFARVLAGAKAPGHVSFLAALCIDALLQVGAAVGRRVQRAVEVSGLVTKERVVVIAVVFVVVEGKGGGGGRCGNGHNGMG